MRSFSGRIVSAKQIASTASEYSKREMSHHSDTKQIGLADPIRTRDARHASLEGKLEVQEGLEVANTKKADHKE